MDQQQSSFDRLLALMNTRLAWTLAGVAGGLAVLLGAFGAHGLDEHLGPHAMEVYRTAVAYQFYHVLALFMVGSFRMAGMRSRLVSMAGWMFVLGLVVFCGTLYLLALTGQRWLGAITPLGGACLVLGWLLLIWAAIRKTRR